MTSELLRYLNLYTKVNVEDFEELMKLVEKHSFEKKVILTNIGEEEQRMYFVAQGLVRKFFYRRKTEVITHIVKEGGIIGSGMSFLSGRPSLYIVETMEPSILFSISKQKLEALFSSDKKWEHFGRIMITHYFLVHEQRLLDNIRYSTRDRFVRFMNENPDLLLRVPQKYLASYLNIKPETFSRLKHLMVKEKMIK